MKCNGLVLFAFFAVSTQAQVLQDIHARLLTPVASYSKVGQSIQIRTGTPVDFGADSILPEGTILSAKVRAAHGVGIGIRRESAILDLEFQRCAPPGHPAAACSVDLIEIENAREQVTRGTRIQGVRAASNPNSLLQGIWYRPAGAFLRRSPTGLTGPVGALQSRLAPNPLGAAVTIASRLLLFSLPNAEIELPVGTEFILRVKASDASHNPVLPVAMATPPSAALSEEERTYLRGIPTEIKNGSGNTVSDRINFAIRGTREEIESAFSAAGWTSADPLTRRSFTKAYAAFTSLRGYAQAPVSHLYYQHDLPEFVFQKSFNSMAKRHHIRFWRIADLAGSNELWIAAATHDIGIAFDWNKFSLTHRVDEFLDKERSKVLNDLSAARCLKHLNMLDRPALAGSATDGDLAVVTMQPCAESALTSVPDVTLPGKPRNPAGKRFVRRLVLETRQYVTRGNAYYLAYRGVRKAVDGLRRASSPLPVVGFRRELGAMPAPALDHRMPQPLP